jgi:hypothetical protein
MRLDGSGVSTGDYAYAVATDRRGNVYTGGLLNTGGGAGTINDITYFNYAPTVPFSAVKVTPYGLLEWHQALTGASTFVTTYGIATDFDCNVIVVGQGTDGQVMSILARA